MARPRSGPVAGHAVHLVQLGEQLDLDGRDEQGLGRELAGAVSSVGGAVNSTAASAPPAAPMVAGRLGRAGDDHLGQVVVGEARVLGPQGRAVPEREPRRDVEHQVGQPGAAEHRGSPGGAGGGRQRRREAAEVAGPLAPARRWSSPRSPDAVTRATRSPTVLRSWSEAETPSA